MCVVFCYAGHLKHLHVAGACIHKKEACHLICILVLQAAMIVLFCVHEV